MRIHTLRGFGLLGVLLFLPLFIFTFADPHLVEKSGKGFIEWKVKQEASGKIDSIAVPQNTSLEKLLGQRAVVFHEKAEARLTFLKQLLKEDAPAIIAEQLAQVRNLDCECRQKWENALTNSLLTRIASVEEAKTQLAEFTQSKYMDIVRKLTLDVRVFLAANSLVFLLLFSVSFFKPAAVSHLFLPGVLLLLSTALCSYFYLFQQNWFYTIIYNDYTGFGYVFYLLLVFAILCDIAFNKGKVTTEIVNGVMSAIGQAGVLVPC